MIAISELRQFKSVQNLLQGDFTKGTEQVYLNDMALFCGFFRENPDGIIELVRNSPNQKEQIIKMVTPLNKFMDEKLGLNVTTIHNDLSGFYSFLRANGIEISRRDVGDIHKRSGVKFRKV